MHAEGVGHSFLPLPIQFIIPLIMVGKKSSSLESFQSDMYNIYPKPQSNVTSIVMQFHGFRYTRLHIHVSVFDIISSCCAVFILAIKKIVLIQASAILIL